MDLRTESDDHQNLRQPVAGVAEQEESGSVLRFENVSLCFDDEIQALDKVTFDLEAGQTMIIFGEAGSGKSVLLKTAIGLMHPDFGSVWLFGQDISKLSELELFEIRPRAGVLFQESALFDSVTVEENVAYPLLNGREGGRQKKAGNPEEVERRVREALRFVELEDTLTKLPSQLSGGMRRRVGIARAAVAEPALMLYDSPTAGLDPITANTIIALILKARDTRNTTSVIVSHRYQDGHMMANFLYNSETEKLEPCPRDSPVYVNTRFVVFREGQLVFTGTQEELEQATDPYVSKFKSGRRAQRRS